eukprot:CAMPEP_0194230952 /NCGR_PEP_ID=MMETSP0156-20130528/44674_1 /TAXON_ID=33649 /ORGANISM="Thalassionema nitzschioides, Strain L26-B" /LENGTH=245 /DNA_ID=CAMNT_0038963553 /DNA_START=459 /DNA_END=1193 /DNA_ORIENTATION=-
MEKFSILRFHSEYKHILFLDADIMPLCNLDYYFDLVRNKTFEPNMVMANNHEPVNAGFFLVSPEAGDYEVLHTHAQFLNETHGYGQVLPSPAEGLEKNYSLWDWHCAKMDQGLLYHWVRFVKKSVTMLKHNRLQIWKKSDTANVGSEVEHEEQNVKSFCPRSNYKLPLHGPDWMRDSSFYQDVYHFTGQKKPWQIVNWTNLEHPASLQECKNMYFVWRYMLRKAWKEYNLGSISELIPNPAANNL